MADEKVEVGERVSDQRRRSHLSEGNAGGSGLAICAREGYLPGYLGKADGAVEPRRRSPGCDKGGRADSGESAVCTEPSKGDRYSGGATADGGTSSESRSGDDRWYSGRCEFAGSKAKDCERGRNRVGGESCANADCTEERRERDDAGSRNDEAGGASGGERDRSE